MVFEIVVIIAGALGGFIKSLMEQNGKVALPKLEVTSEGNYIHFGFMLNVCIGAAMAAASASDPAMALAVGMSSAFLGEKIMERSPLVTGA